MLLTPESNTCFRLTLFFHGRGQLQCRGEDVPGEAVEDLGEEREQWGGLDSGEQEAGEEEGRQAKTGRGAPVQGSDEESGGGEEDRHCVTFFYQSLKHVFWLKKAFWNVLADCEIHNLVRVCQESLALFYTQAVKLLLVGSSAPKVNLGLQPTSSM